MRLTIFAAMFAFLLWGTPAFAGNAPDSDGDGVIDSLDNCSLNTVNPAQDDTDGDGCGNLCDADYDQLGDVGFGDFNILRGVWLGPGPDQNHVEDPPIPHDVGFGDFNFFRSAFLGIPGPSGTTAGTLACP